MSKRLSNLYHDICVLIQSMGELGIAPLFDTEPLGAKPGDSGGAASRPLKVED